MNFSKIVKMQKKLDIVYSKNGLLSNKFIDEKRIAAILVEIGEFANEYAPFKYWKKQKTIEKNKVLEEFVDGIHFFATMINNSNINVNNVKFNVIHNDMSIQLIHTFKAVIEIFQNINPQTILKAFEIYLGNAKLLGITYQKIEEAYITKNKINFERIKNGY